MNLATLLKRVYLSLLILSVPVLAQLTPVQNVPINGSNYVYGTSTYIAWYYNGYEAGITTELQVSVNPDMSSPFVDVVGLTGLTYEVTGLVSGETYYWRVRSKSAGGAYSAWTGIWSFTVGGGGGGGATPLVPVLNIPLDGSDIYDSSTYLAWYLNGSSLGLTFELQVSTSNTFAPLFVDVTGLTDFTYEVNGLADGQTYYWRVRSKNSNNDYSAWSTTFSFNVDLGGGGFTVDPPEHYTPADGTTGFSYHPTLVWHSVSGAFSYDLQVSTDMTFTTVDREYYGLVDTSYHIHYPKATEYLELNTQYFWRVRVTTVFGTSEWSSPWDFTTKDAPDTPTLLAPEDGSPEDYTGVYFTWSDVIKADSYDIEIYLDSTLAAVHTANVTDTVYFYNGSASTTYYWRVRSEASGNYSAYSWFWSYTTGTYTIWYVETPGNGGDDLNSGTSPDDPFATIQKAIDEANAGDKISVGDGTFEEDLDIQKDNLEIYGTGYSATTTIKGVATEPIGNFVLATPNINIEAKGVKLHDFLIESPDLTNDIYSSGIVFTGQDIEIYNNKFLTISTSDDAFAEGDGYAIVIQSYNNGVYPGSDVSGLKIYDNIFTWEEYTPSGGGIGAYEGIWINPHDESGSGIEITGNTFEGNCRRAIAVQASNAVIDNNIMSTDFFDNRGIWILTGSDHTVSNNDISGFQKGIELGTGPKPWADPLGDNIIVSNNQIYDNQYGVVVSDDFSVSTPTVPPVINNNSIYDNGAGLDVRDALGAPGYFYLNAENNFWGSVDGPADNEYYGGVPNEMPAGSAALVKTWFNGVAEISGILGNNVLEDDTYDAGATPSGFYVDYYPWLGGTPYLDIEDEVTSTGATVTLDVTTNLFSESINYTFSGRFTYDDSELDFLSGTVGALTLLNNAGWSAFFYESTSGVVDFIAWGFAPLTGQGTLFSLSFTVIAGADGATLVEGDYVDFLADGVNLFGALGTFSGNVSYTYSPTPSTVKGDADLDFDVDFDDVLLMAQHVGGAITLTGQAFTNADVDSDLDVDADDIALTVSYIFSGSWAPVPPPPIALPDMMAFADPIDNDEQALIELPFNVKSSSTPIQSVEFIVVYDQNEIDYQAFKGAFEGNEYFVHANKVSEGIAKFVFASADGQMDAFELGSLKFKKSNAVLNSTVTSLYKINGGSPQTGPSLSLDGITSTENEVIPSDYKLSQNYPNPFNPTTTIEFALPQADYVSIKIYDMLGREVATLINDQRSVGNYSVVWNGINDFGHKVSSGTYIYRITAGNFVQTKKMLLLK